MILSKVLLVWGLIACIEVIHGIVRAKWLAPRVGDFRSRQIGVLTGSILIFITTYLLFPWMEIATPESALRVGILWFICMFIFEMSLGHYVFKFSWKWLLSDFNILKGRLLILGMIFLMLAPWIVGRVHQSW